MKKILKTAALLGILTLVLFATVACDDIMGNLFGTTEEPHTHTFGSWTTTKNATCKEKGQQERTCSCGEKEIQEIDALSHTETLDAAVASTCTTDGLTAGSHCSVCGTVLVEQEVIPAAHNWSQIALLESATCFTYGEERRGCRVCGVEENAPVEPLKHDFVIDEETQYQTCTLCNGILFAGHLYAAFEEEGYWFDAYKLCTEMDGHLASITSAREQEIISNMMNSELRTREEYYIGGLLLTDGKYHWITQETFEYSNWASGEPNNRGGIEYFISVRSCLSDHPTSSWDDYYFNRKLGFICEWELDIPDCEHTFTEWEPLTEATCWSDGEQYRICIYCGKEETEVLTQLEHNFVLNEESGIEMCEHCNAGKQNGHIYVVFTDACNWFDAYARCEALGGHLATITSEEEQTLVASYCKLLQIRTAPWIGGYFDNENWHWVTDEPFEYTNWMSREPSLGGVEWFIQINYKEQNYQWNDLPPTDINVYICEFECEE